MRILCVSQNLPNELEPIALALANEHEVFMASQMKAPLAPCVRSIHLKKSVSSKYDHSYLGYLGLTINLARNAQRSWEILGSRNSPHLILSCASNGIALNLPNFFPQSFIVSYPDSKLLNLKTRDNELFKVRSMVQEVQYGQSDLCIARLPEDRKELTKLGSRQFQTLPLFTDCCSLKRNPGNKLLVIGGALSDQDIKYMLDSILKFLNKFPEREVTIWLENNLRRFSWDDLQKLPEFFTGRITLVSDLKGSAWKTELANARLLFCPQADRSIMQRLLDGMAAGCPLLAGQPYGFLKEGKTAMALTGDWAEALEKAWNNLNLQTEIGINACQAGKAFDIDRILRDHIDMLMERCLSRTVH